MGPQDDDLPVAAMRRAIDLGHSEEIVGRLLREIGSSSRPLVFTTAGVSNFGVDLLERGEALRHVDSLQPPSR